jgi:ABC-type Fe3+/spermidine/putrescine transport system ATPase subunit
MTSGLRLKDVHKSYAKTQALSGVSFEVVQGEIIALLGPSGCGKSTTLALIAGLETPERGEITWDGASLDGIPPHQRGFGLMFQDLALFPHLNVTENIAFGLRMAGWSEMQTRKRVQEMLDLTGLPGFGQRDVNTLSGGEQQRVALARSLVPSPRLLMLDEPLGALDRNLRERLLIELREILLKMKQTAIYVTHDQEEAFVIADRVVVMNAGGVEQIGAPQAVYRQPASVFVARFLGLNNLLSGEVVRVGGQNYLDLPICRIPFTGNASGKVTVLIHPDAVELNGNGDCQIEGRVLMRSFRGSICRATVEVNGVRLSFEFLSGACVPPEGEKVKLGFNQREAIQIFE